MKFNVEIDIDWYGEDGLDDAVQRKITDSVAKQLMAKLEDGFSSQVARDAQRLLTAKTEMLINGVLEKPVSVSTGWESAKQYDSLYDMIEEQMTDLYTGKLSAGAKCKKDPLLDQIEKYVKAESERYLQAVEKKITTIGKEIAKSEINAHELIKAVGVVVGDGSRGTTTVQKS